MKPVVAQRCADRSALPYRREYRDSETGLHLLRARDYDPPTGQFLSRDPATATTGQPYAYVGGDTLNAEDPTSLYAALTSPAHKGKGVCGRHRGVYGDPGRLEGSTLRELVDALLTEKADGPRHS